MRNAKLWSVLLAAVLLCACVVGVLFVGASAGTEAYVYSVGAIDGIEADDPSATSIKDALNKAAEATWASDAKVEIVFASADTSADVTSPGEGESANLLFGQTTIWRGEGETKSKLPITIKGSGDAAAITAPAKTVACANDYTFEDLTYTVTSSCVFYAGSGNVTFTEVSFSSVTGYFYADNFTQDAFAGWDALEDGEYVETSITFGEGTSYYSTTSRLLSAVGYNPNGHSFSEEKDILNADGTVNEAVVAAIRAEAAKLTFDAPTIVGVECADIRPIHTKTTFTIDNQLATGYSAPRMYVRVGASPVASSTAEYKRTYSRGMTADYHSDSDVETYVGDIKMVLDGCTLEDTGIYFRGLNSSNLIGNFTAEIHDTPDDGFDTKLVLFQGTHNKALVIGDYEFNMTGGTLGDGSSTNDGYWGAANATGTIINHVSGGNIWQFGGARYNITFCNTPVTLPDGTEKNVSVRNIISGGTFGGTEASNTSASPLGGFYGASHSKGDSGGISVPVVCNEISGGTFHKFTGAGNANRAVAGNDIINVITGDPTFECDYIGGSTSKAAASITNYISGGDFGTVYGAYMHDVTGSVTNVISGSVVIPTFYGAYDYDADTEESAGHTIGSVKNTVSGGTIGTYVLNDADKFEKDTRTYYYGAYYVTGSDTEITNEVEGGEITSYYGAYGGTVKKISNTIKSSGTVGINKAYDKETACYWGAYSASAETLENHFEGGNVYFVYGAHQSNIPEIKNFISGATIGRNFVGAYYMSDGYKVINEISSGLINCSFQGAYNRNMTYAAEIENEITGGEFKSSVSLGGYGGQNVTSVTNIIEGEPTFAGSVYFGAGSSVWATKIGSVETRVKGGTFKGNVYGGNASSHVTGDITTYLQGGTFEKYFYGGNVAPFFAGSNKLTSSYGYSVEGTIYNYVGVEGKEDGPTIANFVGGDEGAFDRIPCVTDGTVVNTIYGGTFTKNAWGGYSGSAYISRQFDPAGDETWEVELSITNNIYGGTFQKSFYGGCGGNAFTDRPASGSAAAAYAATLTKCTIKNEIEGGVFTGAYYGGFDAFNDATYDVENRATLNIDISNTFSGGQLCNLSNYMGNGDAIDSVGVIENIFNEGFITDGAAYVYGGGNGIHTAPEGKNAITNTINGGNFRGFWGVGGNSEAIVTGNVQTTVNGGTFDLYEDSDIYPAFCGGTRNGLLTGNVTTIINGGTFNGRVAGSTQAGGETLAKAGTGNITTTINGGTFNDEIFRDSVYESIVTNGTVVLDITDEAEAALAIFGSVTADQFKMNGETVEIGKNTNIVAADATGTVTFKQTEGWLAHDYFKAEGASISVTVEEAAGIFGAYDDSEETLALVLVTGKGIDASGVTLILDERLGVRFLFDKALVDQYGDEFTYEFTMEKADDTYYTFAGGYDDLELYTDSEGSQYWSFIAYGIGLRDFGTTFSVTGSALNSLKDDRDSIVELAQIAKGSWTGEWLAYAEAVENFHKVYSKEDPNWTALEPAVPEKTEVSAEKGEAEYNSATAGLAMGDAVAVNFELKLAAAPTNFTVKVNGNPIENAATIVTGEGETTVTVDLYFHAKHMAADFEIVLSSDAGIYFTYKGSVAAMAYQLANAAESETITETTKANANALLYYIEKTVACANL